MPLALTPNSYEFAEWQNCGELGLKDFVVFTEPGTMELFYCIQSSLVQVQHIVG
jgi:hypothetical protein